ncbi:MAG: hypothetical protein ACR2P5_02335 [Gammaproteobacteria bacterium]
MTLTINNRATATALGNGVQTSFPFGFPIRLASDLDVYQDDVLQLDSAYAVTGIGNPLGGNVVFLTPPGAGVRVDIIGDTPLEQQLVSLVPRGAISSSGIEAFADQVMKILQEMDHRLAHALQFRLTADFTTPVLPDPQPDTLLGWDANGNLVNSAAATGPQGLQGPAGADGAQGIQGIQGLTGPQGPIGPSGGTALRGLVDPNGVQVGDEGQFYVNETTAVTWFKPAGSGSGNNTGWIQTGAAAAQPFVVTHTPAAGLSVDTIPGVFPANSVADWAVGEVTATFTGISGIRLGDAVEGDDIWAGDLAPTAGSQSTIGDNKATPVRLFSAAPRGVKISAIGGTFDGTGQVQVTSQSA